MKSVGTVSAGTALDVTAPTLRPCCLDSCKDSIFQGCPSDFTHSLSCPSAHE
jgi:hypothetical protein